MVTSPSTSQEGIPPNAKEKFNPDTEDDYTASCAFRLERGWTIWGGGQMDDWGAGSTWPNSGLYHRICVSFGPEGEPQYKLPGGQPQHEFTLGALRPKGAESSREMAQQALIPTIDFLVRLRSVLAIFLFCS